MQANCRPLVGLDLEMRGPDEYLDNGIYDESGTLIGTIGPGAKCVECVNLQSRKTSVV
jgi:hypothetical protein